MKKPMPKAAVQAKIKFPPPSRKVERDYYADLLAMLRRYFGELEGLEFLADAKFPIPTWLDQFAWQLAHRMVTGVLTESSRNWRQAAQASMQGPEMTASLQRELAGAVGRRVRQLVGYNAELIRSLPISVARRVSLSAATLEQAGGRAEDLRGGMQAALHLSKSKSALIARTEVGKATTALTRARSEDLDLPWYIWETSRDGRVRHSHREMSGVLVRWSDAPSPEALAGEKSTLGQYHAGDAPNDRCYPAPLLKLDQVTWPHKIYYSGRVQYATLAQFRKLNSKQSFLKEAA